MATRSFCDYCDDQITPENSGPLIREQSVQLFKDATKDGAAAPQNKLRASIMVLNEHDHIVQDICHKCQLSIVEFGATVKVREISKIATLQQPVAADQEPPVRLFAGASPIKAQPVALSATPPPPPHEKAPPAEETVFVPSTTRFPASAGDASQKSE